MNAPVCPVSRSQVPPGMPGMMRPFIPMSFNLPSALAAANQAAQAVRLAFGPGPVSNNLFPSIVPAAVAGGYVGVHKQVERWREISRHTNEIRFYAKDDKGNIDKDQWIDVERIVYIQWRDTVQRIDLTFEWPYDPREGGMVLKVDGKWVVAPQ